MPTLNGSACRTEIQNASTVCPESVRPLRSVIVTDSMTGRRTPRSSKISSHATMAAFAFSVSKIVSMRSASHPPSTRPRTWSR